MSETVKQHFVPEVYLKAFKDGLNGKIWRWKRNPKYQGPIRAFSSSQICHQKDFYEMDNQIGKKVPKNHLEREWKIYENEWKSFVNIFESQQSIVENSKLKKIIFSVLSLKLRNLSIRTIYQGREAQEIADRNIERTIKEFSKAGYLPEQISEIEQYLRNRFDMKDSIGKNLHNNLLLSIIEGDTNSMSFRICNKLSNHEAKILQTVNENPFVTSDNPGFFIDQNGKFHNTKYLDKNGEVDFSGFFLPLTPKLCLFVSPNEDPDSSKPTRSIEYLLADSFLGDSGGFVSEHNFWTLSHCNESAFSNNKTVLEKSVTYYESRISRNMKK